MQKTLVIHGMTLVFGTISLTQSERLEEETFNLDTGKAKTTRYRDLKVFLSLESWDLKDNSGKPVPLTEETFFDRKYVEKTYWIVRKGFDTASEVNNLTDPEKKTSSEPSATV